MDHKEFAGAWTAVQIAVRMIAEYDRDRATLPTLAYSYGSQIATNEHIDQVLACIDLKKLMELIE